MGFFITKKSKHAIKERRKKKLLAEKGLLPPPSTTKDNDHAKKELHSSSSNNYNNKRLRSEITMEGGGAISKKKKVANPPSQHQTTTTTTIDSTPIPQQLSQVSAASSIHSHQKETKNNKNKAIVIPSNLSHKDSKKFRKDTRRQMRANGTIQDDDDVKFVVEGCVDDNTTGPIKKKPKLIFPCINDLVRQQQKQQDAQGSTPTEQLSSTNRNVNQEQEVLDEAYTSQYVALDCEMVGIGNQGRQSALARVSIVDWHYNVLLDTYVQVPMKVTDYRTQVSGIKPKHIQPQNNAMDVHVCRTSVANILKNKILVGHALKNDLDALMLTHAPTHIRDTAKYRPFQRLQMSHQTQKWRPRKLRDLVAEHVRLSIQQAGQSHNSVEDATATMKLFQTVHPQWESDIAQQQQSLSKKKSN